jgi:hypothetical protein
MINTGVISASGQDDGTDDAHSFDHVGSVMSEFAIPAILFVISHVAILAVAMQMYAIAQ